VSKAVETEHAGAKDGGGYWGRRAVAKAVSKRLRRVRGKELIRNELRR